ncbi:MAG: DUF3450 domain-containing protein [Verrucomicrobia bacterium]|jgi:hypothetical protein|nr:DUF3450 domain-containing protein [Verrucomicrobiota bacterium]
MRHGILTACVALFPLTQSFAQGEDLVGGVRTTVEQWVQTRQLISRSQADWQGEKDMLDQTIALYERELGAIGEQMTKVSTNNTQVAAEMADAGALKESSIEAVNRVRTFATEFEARLKAAAPQLPAPLQESIKPLMLRLPADPATTKMLAAERLQVIVGILNELDKFNSAVNLFNEKIRNDKGEEVSVETLYVGLGAAYFVNQTADFAGVGTPGPNGWQWTSKSDIASVVQEAVQMYRNERTARFLKLPVTIQ